ncbi:MAG: tRNA 4-thiouridine(8) synthase ThiI [Methanosarcinales archaeon]|nr:tRNA 4-thiouridine(8) synthase ThiI [Methanosarcinales archaeon]
MTVNDIVLIRYGEIALKSSTVRNRYEKTLMSNIRSMLDAGSIEYSDISREWGRIYIHTTDPDAAKSASKVFGVVSVSPAITCAPTLESAASNAADVGEVFINEGDSFGVRPRRSGRHSFSSRDIGVACGDAIWERIEDRHPMVDLTSPDKEIFVEIRQDHGYVFTEIVQGVGGLPLGTQGRMVALVSGGIDSPVAAWLMMKRGCVVIPVYVNNDPFSDETTRQRAFECIRVLQNWAPSHPFTVYEVPNGDSQVSFLSECNPHYTCVLCRRMMYRIASGIMEKEHALGIITGASLGQVASQTAENMLAETCGIHVPIYHPLIGLDKTEIVDIARRIGTFDASTKPATCCTAVPEKPVTAAKCKNICNEEAEIDVQVLLQTAMSGARIVPSSEYI